MASETFFETLRDHMRAEDRLARRAANHGDHLEALVHLTSAHAYATATVLYRRVYRNRTQAIRQQDEVNIFQAQIELVRLVLGLQGGQTTGAPGSVEVFSSGYYGTVPEPREPADLSLLVRNA